MGLRTTVIDGIKQSLPTDTRKRIMRARLSARSLTAFRRALPDFLIIGTERGGTSSLFKYLSRHPHVAPSLRKETEFFNRHFDRGVDWYRSHFQLQERKRLAEATGRQSLAFEATPMYLQDPRVAARVAELLPDSRLIVLLRNPVARALSGWKHMTELGFETLSFEEAIDAEESRTAPELERMLSEPLYFSRAYHRFGYIDRGKYAEQLERWFEVFPRDRVLILESERFYRDTADVFGEITDFLDLPKWEPDEFRMYSSATSTDPAGAAKELPAQMRSSLEETYRPHNAALVNLLGREFSWADLA